MKPQNFNDLFALVVCGGILILWVISGIGGITLPDIVTGGSISIFTLIVQFYFRKSKTES